MKQIKYKLLLCLFSILTSCETIVETPLPAHEPKLVVNAVINPDSLFTVDVSANQSAFDHVTYQQLPDATVQVYQAGQPLHTLHHRGNGIYKTDQKPLPLQHYELHVAAPGFAPAQASAFIPSAPVIRDLQNTAVAPTAWEGPTISVSFTLADTPGQENYYYLQAYTPDTSHTESKPYNRSVGLKLADPVESEFSLEDRYFFSDKLFEGQTVTLWVHLDNSPKQTTYLRVAHITREYYAYARTLEKQSYRDNFATPPGPVANNIQNGMGIFAGYNALTLAIKP
ncbi:DUF4249 domain-containing protein [Pontibacter liquoris]|uniref:DUF4249 domain-containing protein n=1 Tax=Pontibacter liquoris TaxID=2905677 RepID=UPI001FA7F311|nr:DUF4249 domain-containing protein [Pontibacter liquoris]